MQGLLSLTAKGFKLKSACPGAALLSLDGSKVVEVRPEGKGTRTVSRRRVFGGSGVETRLEWRTADGFGLRWRVLAHSSLPGMLVGAAVSDFTGKPWRIKSIGLLDGPLSCDGAPVEWMLSTVAHKTGVGNLAERFPSPNQLAIEICRKAGKPVPGKLPTDEYHTDGSWRCFEEYLSLYRDAGRTGFFAAPVGEPISAIDFRCKVKGCELRLKADAAMGGALLEPGQWREAQEVALLALPYADATDVAARWIASTHGVRTSRKPVVGWCSWNCREDQITAEEVIGVTRKVAKERSRIPLDVIQIDYGYSSKTGLWDCNKKFASGWEPIVKAIRSAGAKPGIWLAPLLVDEDTDIFRSHPDWFQRDQGGELTGSWKWQFDPDCGTSRLLDPTHPGARDFIFQLLRRFRDIGFEYFKMDFQNLDVRARFHDPTLTRLQAFRSLQRLYREAIGEDAYLLSQGGRACAGFADASRIGPDSNSKWKWEDRDNSCCIFACLKFAGGASFMNRTLLAADPDMTYVGLTGYRGTLSETEWRTWHSYVGVLGGSTLVSDLLHEEEPSRKLRNLEILIPPAPEAGRSLQGGTDPFHKLLGFVARRPWGDAATLVAYNPADNAVDAEIDLGLLDLTDCASYRVWSFWDGKTWRFEGCKLLVGKLEPHGCALLRITPEPALDVPLFLGSTLHISCGAAELLDFRRADGWLELSLGDAGARDGSLYVAWHGGMVLDKASDLELTRLSEDSPGVWRLDVKSRERGARQKVRLKLT